MQKEIEELKGLLEQTISKELYPNEMEEILCEIPATAFFPGGAGLYKEDGAVDFPKGKIMVVGHDFGTLGTIKKTELEKFNEVNAATWRTLLKLLNEVNIDAKDCFFTNTIMGLRLEGKNHGKPLYSIKSDAEFYQKCKDFFIRQIQIQQPKMIISLGKYNIKFILEALEEYIHDSNFDKHKKINSFASLDEAKCQSLKKISINNLELSLVFLVHPSFRGPNLKHRSFENYPNGHHSEIAMLKSTNPFK